MRRISLDSLPHMVSCARFQARGQMDTTFTRVLALWWGVRIGAGCRFFGLPLFRRMPGSGIYIGDNCTFNSAYWSNMAGLNRRCTLSTLGEDAELVIGENCGFSGAVIGAAERIVLGDRVMVGANSTIVDTDFHPLDARRRFANEPGRVAPVTIADDVWLGLNVLVLKGVSIGRSTVVAANSVVAESLPEGVLAAGTPARVIRELERS